MTKTKWLIQISEKNTAGKIIKCFHCFAIESGPSNTNNDSSIESNLLMLAESVAACAHIALQFRFKIYFSRISHLVVPSQNNT